MHKVKSTIIKVYLNSIRFYHLENDINIIILNDSYIDLVLRDGKCVYEKKKCRIRLSFIYDILLRIMRKMRNNFDDFNVKIIFYMTFIEFLWFDEFTWETWNAIFSIYYLIKQYIKFINNYINLTFSIIFLAQIISFLCFIKAFIKLFQEYPRQKDEFLFTWIVNSFNK